MMKHDFAAMGADEEYLRMKFRAPELDTETGLDFPVLKSELLRLEEEWHNLPKQVLKARLFAFCTENIQFSVSEHDYFPAFGNWNRADLPLAPILNKWNTEVDQKIPEAAEAIRTGNHAGRFAIWKDFDHSVPDWDAMLQLGFPGLLARAKKYRTDRRNNGQNTPESDAYFDGLEITYRAIIAFLLRVRDYIRTAPSAGPRCIMLADALDALSARAPETFYEALLFQFLYFMFSEHFDRMQVRSLGNFDRLLAPYFENDLKHGNAKEAELRTILDHFFLQWSSINNYWGQPVMLGGFKENGGTEINGFSYVILEELEKLRVTTPKFQIKLDNATPRPFIRQALRMIRDYNASLVFVCYEGYLKAFQRYGFTEEDIRTCDVSGCYELRIRGRHNATIPAYLNLLKLVELTLNNGTDPVTGLRLGPETGAPESFATFDDFLAAWKKQLEFAVNDVIAYCDAFEPHLAEINAGNVYSATMEHSLKTARDAFADGCEFNTTQVLLIGAATTTDALLAIRKFVFQKGILTLNELRDILAANWSGSEDLRRQILNDPEKYGNGLAQADSLAREITSYAASLINGRKNTRGGWYETALHTARQYIELGRKTGATPDGRCAGDEMSKNMSPTMGMDRSGVTALLRSMLTIDSSLFSADCPLDVMLLPSSVQGEAGIDALEALIQTYRKHNGLTIQFNTFSPETLIDAQAHPENYEGLQVRVCGWNVRFNDMDKREQDEYVKRAKNLSE